MTARKQNTSSEQPIRRVLEAFRDVFALNPRERLVIAVIAGLLLLGTCIRLAMAI